MLKTIISKVKMSHFAYSVIYDDTDISILLYDLNQAIYFNGLLAL